jgi:hypothetical protein
MTPWGCLESWPASGFSYGWPTRAGAFCWLDRPRHCLPPLSRASRCSQTGLKHSWRRRRTSSRNSSPCSLLGALFGKLMDDSGSALAIARAGRAIGPGAGDPCHRACRHVGIDRDERQIRLFSIELSPGLHFRAAGAAGQAPEADDDGPPRGSFDDAPCPRCSLSPPIQNIGLD